MVASEGGHQDRTRARDLGIPLAGQPGPYNAITDVAGVLVGHETLNSGKGKLVVGRGPIRTGVTAVLPRKDVTEQPAFAATFCLNGGGEMTGTLYVAETGLLRSPILLTNTHSVGAVRDAVIDWCGWDIPVVAETWDGTLNDIAGGHVTKAHVFGALDKAGSGPVAEGNCGGGTGMVCYHFKGGIGTASRELDSEAGTYTVGVLVQANHGARNQLTIAGVPVGREITDRMPDIHRGETAADHQGGSIVAIIATDAPLLPVQLKRVAKRVALGLARQGSTASHWSHESFIAFSTAVRERTEAHLYNLKMLSHQQLDPLFTATVEAIEEAVVNAMVAAETMTGINSNTVYALPHDGLKRVLRKYNRLAG